MLDLMAVNQDDTAIPVYIHIVHRILREMHVQQQSTGTSFNYGLFKSKVAEADWRRLVNGCPYWRVSCL
jgi:hypothetical protein